MDALRNAGVIVHSFNLDTDIDESIIDSIGSVQFYGAVPFSFEPVLKYFKEKGIKIVYDMDDALDLIELSNPFYYSVKKDLGSSYQLLECADEVTVSTPQMELHARTMGYKGKVTIIPNCYMESEWALLKSPREGMRVGFAGASPHVPDLIEVLPIIKRLQDKYGFEFYIMGFGQTTYEEWFKQYRYIAQPEATKELRKLDELLKGIQYQWVPFVDHALYPKTLTNLTLDIGICPLKDTPFNNARSACKAMEYNLAGALVLASEVVPYENEKNSVLVEDGKWEEKLEFYLLNPDITRKTYEEQLEWTKENRNITTQVDVLKEIYVV